MCEYCVQHGGGKKWYLETRNYLRNLKIDDHRHREFGNDFVGHFMDKYDIYLKTNKKESYDGRY